MKNIPANIPDIRCHIKKTFPGNFMDLECPTKLLFFDYDKEIDNLPPSVKKMSISGNSLKNVPHGITHLSLWSYYKKPLPELPSTLQHLSISSDYDYDLRHLPRHIRVERY